MAAKKYENERYRVVRSFDSFTEGEEFTHVRGHDAELDALIDSWAKGARVIRRVADGVSGQDAGEGGAGPADAGSADSGR